MAIEQLHAPDFLDRVKRSADYFADTLKEILEKPLELSAKVETKNKQAIRRLSNTLPDLRQTWMGCRFLLTKIAERGFSVDIYLKEKQMSMLDAIDEQAIKPKRQRSNATKTPKEQKPKTWEVSLQLYKQGLKPDLIAHDRGLSIGTIIGHLSRYVASHQVDFNDLVPQEHQKAIRRVLSMTGKEENLAAIKTLCPPDVSYEEIRLMIEAPE